MASHLRFDGRDYTKCFPADERNGDKSLCMCAATGVLFFVPLISGNESQYGKFWANQGLITLLVETACVIVGLIAKLICWLLSLIPFIGVVFDFLYAVIFVALWAVAIFYVACGLYYTAKCRAKNLPFIGYVRFIK